MDNNNNIVKYTDIYKENPPNQWNVLDDHIKIRDNDGAEIGRLG